MKSPVCCLHCISVVDPTLDEPHIVHEVIEQQARSPRREAPKAEHVVLVSQPSEEPLADMIVNRLNLGVALRRHFNGPPLNVAMACFAEKGKSRAGLFIRESFRLVLHIAPERIALLRIWKGIFRNQLVARY